MSFLYNSDEEKIAVEEYRIGNTIELITDDNNIPTIIISDESSYASTDITPVSQQVEYIFDLTDDDYDVDQDDTSSADTRLSDESPAESDVSTPVIGGNRPNMKDTSSKMLQSKKIICKSCSNFMVMYTNYIYSRCVFCNNDI
ncbi:uncharacterized protein LOC111038329 [Myzus persicae]|uniref:uncharacterized protein LOC111038329 n=1 Tax=Myzus persicae TaxID=13164 RepID=UPI000B93205F|nr:uncharacterized protein LOC111038329 [Myzus persicae]